MSANIEIIMVSERHAPVANRIMRDVLRFHHTSHNKVANMARVATTTICERRGLVVDPKSDHFHEIFSDMVVFLSTPHIAKSQGLRLAS